LAAGRFPNSGCGLNTVLAESSFSSSKTVAISTARGMLNSSSSVSGGSGGGGGIFPLSIEIFERDWFVL
jgi:hypothetical protein